MVNERVSLKNINMNINSGEVHVVMYKLDEEVNALVNAMLRLNDRYEGNIFYDGVDILDIDEYEYRQNYVSAIVPENGLIRQTSVKQNMYLQMRMSGISKPLELKESILKEKSEIAGVSDELIGKSYPDMTRVEYDRLVLLKGLIKNSGAIIMKDILGNLPDRVEIYKRLKKLASRQKTSIIVFHKPSDVGLTMEDYSIIDKLYYFKRGRILTIKH